jgi:AcrR family transcriptional regulator
LKDPADAAPTTRELLINSTVRLFTARGYEAMTVDDIAQAAGLTTGAIYASFASKEQLIAEAVAYAEDAFETGVRDAAGRAKCWDGATDRLAVYLRATARLLESAPAMMAFRAVAGIELARQPQIGAAYGDLLARRHAFCLSLVEDAPQVTGALSQRDLVDVTLVAAEGMAALPTAGMVRADTSIPAVAEELAHLLFATPPCVIDEASPLKD